MKQVVQNFRTGELKVETLPPPALRPGGVLVRTAFSLISAGTERTTVETAQSSLAGKALERPDLVRQVIDTFKREGLRSTYEKVKAKLNQVKALGYSASGVVLSAGEGAEAFQAGDRVACAGVGYASHSELIFVPANLCVRLPDAVSLESASYTTLGAIAFQGVRQADVRLGETVAVIGLGLVGQITVQLLKASGCRVLGVDIDPKACQLAMESGADAVAGDHESARAVASRITAGRGIDSIIITAGTKSNEPVELAGEIARDRGRVVIVGLVGVDVPRSTFYGKELDLRHSRSYGPGRYDPQYEEKGIDYPIGYVRWTENRNMEAFVDLIAEGKIRTDILTTHRYTIDRAADAYDLILGKSTKQSGESGSFRCGVVLEYPETSGGDAQIKSYSTKSLSRDELGVSFIGAGNFARGVLLPIVKRASKVQLIGIATATGISGNNTAQQFGFAYSTTDYGKIVSDDSANTVFIATRHDTHARLAAECIRKGKSVFVEKPVAIDEEGLRDVAGAALETGGLFMAGFNRRFSPLAREIRSEFENRTGKMTILYRVNAGQMEAGHWTLDPLEGGGRIIGEVCHFIDFAQYLTGSLPSFVSAQSVARPEGSTDDSAVLSIRFADGSIASIIYTATGDTSAGKEHVEVFCDRATAVIEDFKTGSITRGGRSRRIGSGTQDKGHAAEVEAFLEAARGRAPHPISIESLVATTLATFAAVRSARSGNAEPVETAGFLVPLYRDNTVS